MKRKYAFFEQVDSSTNLGKLFNMCLKSANMMRLAAEPVCYEVKEEHRTSSAIMFYESCLFELYIHSVIDGLTEWKKNAEKYCNEFSCSWRCYATAKRYDLVSEYGGDDDDYDEQNNFIPAGDEKLKSYSIVSDMIDDDWRNIFTTTELTDLEPLFSAIHMDSTFNVLDFFKETTGKSITTYKANKQGEVAPTTWTDDITRRIERELKGEELQRILTVVLTHVHFLVQEAKGLRKDDDNKEFFESLPSYIDNIFDLRLKDIEYKGIG